MQQSHTEAQAQAVPDPKPRSIRKFTEAQNTQSDDNKESQKETGSDDVLESTEIGLHIYTTKEQGWPKANFTVEKLVQSLRNNKFKFTYDDYSLDDERLFTLMLTNKLIYKDECWQRIEKDEFRKLRSGLNKERSPIANRDPRVHKPSYD